MPWILSLFNNFLKFNFKIKINFKEFLNERLEGIQNFCPPWAVQIHETFSLPKSLYLNKTLTGVRNSKWHFQNSFCCIKQQLQNWSNEHLRLRGLRLENMGIIHPAKRWAVSVLGCRDSGYWTKLMCNPQGGPSAGTFIFPGHRCLVGGGQVTTCSWREQEGREQRGSLCFCPSVQPYSLPSWDKRWDPWVLLPFLLHG